MSFTPRMGRRWSVCGLILLAACTDRDALAPSPPVPDGISLARLDCRVSVRQATLQCSSAAPVTPAGVNAERLIGNQDLYVKLASAGTAYDGGAQVLSSNVTVQNLIAASLGTPDGVSLTGVRVFFASGPTVTSGSGTVTLNNADGTGTFTGSDQPYYLYNEILTSYQISSARQWIFNVPNTVNTFGFTVYVAAEVSGNPTVLLDAVWQGDVSTAWETATNWSDDMVPDSASVVTIPSDSLLPSHVFPVLADSADVAHLRVGTASTLGLGGFILRVRGNVDGTGVISNGTIWMSGTGALLNGYVPALSVTGSASLQGYTRASAPVSVSGSLSVKDRVLNISIP